MQTIKQCPTDNPLSGFVEHCSTFSAVVTIENIRPIALSLPRAHEALVRDRVKFRVGSIVWLAFSRDEQTMGFAFPKEERDALIASNPEVFFLPIPSEMRFNWCELNLGPFEPADLEEFVVDAWALAVPKKVSESERGLRDLARSGRLRL
jgi:hypothetical protein